MRHLIIGTCFLWTAVFFVTVTSTARGEDRSHVVQPAEMEKARDWFNKRTEALSGKTSDVDDSYFHGVSQGWGTFQVGWSVNHLPLKLNGKIYETGIAAHADGVVEMKVPAGAKRLTGVCGLDDTKEDRETPNPVWFSIEADGKEVWRSKPNISANDPLPFDVDLTGIKTITLKGTGVGHLEYTPLDWADLKLTLADGSVRELGQRMDFQNGTGGCFSFVYDGKPSADFLSSWKLTQEDVPSDEPLRIRRITRTDPATGLQCVVEMKLHTRYPVVEWTLSLRNTGSQDTPIIENIRSMDISFPAVDDILLHHHTGDYDHADGYEPHVTPLKEGTALHFAPNGGRPTDKAWPYYNIEDSTEKKGAIVVTAWPGQWSSDFIRSASEPGVLRVTAGQELTHLRLHPGEQITTPLSVVLFYDGDAVRAQNVWRRWMLDENVPKPNGQIPGPIFSTSLGLHQSEKTEIDGIKMYTEHGVKFSHWWMDAGWYPCKMWWDGVGSWYPDPERFPNGIKAVSDVVHANNMQLILWFEPERVHKGTWLFVHHPEWLLGTEGDERLLDLGNPAAWDWLVNHLDDVFKQQGVDLYRQDFNEESLGFWRANDAPDRQGMTEIRHVEGYLALWDELHRRHPNLLIDTCASGGRRLDLQTLRRSVSLWRSDHSTDNESNQSQTLGLAQWVPLFGSGIGCDSSYVVRGEMLPFFSIGLDPAKKMDWDLFNRESEIWRKVRDEMLGDFYPLLPYSLDTGTWMAWQFDRPENGSGLVQAFRRPTSPFSVARFPLHELDAHADYVVSDMDTPDSPVTISGQSLLSEGLEIRMDQKPGAKVFLYKKK